MNKFLYGTIATLLLTITFLFYKYNATSKALENEKYKNISLESKLQDSNNALEKIKLDTKEYLQQREKQNKAIQDKYTTLLQEHKKKELELQKAYKNSVSKLYLHTQDNVSNNIKDISGLSHQYDNITNKELKDNIHKEALQYQLQQCNAILQTAKDMLQAF